MTETIRRTVFMVLLLVCPSVLLSQTVNVVTRTNASEQELYAAEYLEKKLNTLGYKVQGDGFQVVLELADEPPVLPDEAYQIIPMGKEGMRITASGAKGIIYGAVEYADQVKHQGRLDVGSISEEPHMVMRGTCIGLQKTVYLPGHTVYEYPYTPENFPWFYDKEQWLRYLDMMVECKMNSLYLWNGHPFASLVRLEDYPFAVEVDDETFRKNEEMFSFLTREASRRGIWVIQMFYNIILSKPFADHYGLKTQDRNRPITPLIADYTRKSIAAFIKKYPNVGLLVCLGEAMATIEDDVEWMTKTIIPGILDGIPTPSPSPREGGKFSSANESNPSLLPSGRAGDGLPPIVLRAHDTDGPRVLAEALKLYPNIYTMSKYTGESLTTYEPGGPWGETHRELAAAAPVHIDNVHILANLEPWRWSSPTFIRKAVGAMHSVHNSRGLHLYPQASYWDWPYTADRVVAQVSQPANSVPVVGHASQRGSSDIASQQDGSGEDADCHAGKRDLLRLFQLDRDWMWYRAWGRYAWNDQRGDDKTYWTQELSQYYGITEEAAAHLLTAYDEAGEIAPKLLRRFGITEGNRQTLLLGMKMAQLVNPFKFNVYPGFYESCGPMGEKLIDYVEFEHFDIPHNGELPLDIAQQCVDHGNKAVEAFSFVLQPVATHSQQTEQLSELLRIGNDMRCYQLFAQSFQQKVLAAYHALRYKWTKDISDLDTAVPFLEKSVALWRELADITDSTYLYANSMQTAQRRIPVGGDNGNYKTWREMLPVYEEELEALKTNIEKLKHPAAQTDVLILPSKPAPVRLFSAGSGTVAAPTTVPLAKGSLLFENRADTPVDSLAPELQGLNALVLNRDSTRIVGTTFAFETDKPVKLLVGFFQDDDPKWAKPPKLETDATGNEYGQAEPVLVNAIAIEQMPKVNIHAYSLPAGRHTLRLPKGILIVAGFTADAICPRDCALNGPSTEVDWLFQK